MEQPKQKTQTNDIELYFRWFIQELKEAGYIVDYFRENYKLECVPKATLQRYDFKRKTKHNVEDFTLLNADNYTYDYMIVWDAKAQDIFYSLLDGTPFKTDTPFLAYANQQGQIISLCDVKPAPGQKIFGNNTTGYTFPVKQKILWYLHKIYINKVIPIPQVSKGEIKSGNADALFTNVFCPRRYTFTDGGGAPRKIHYKIRTMAEYVRSKSAEVAVIKQRLGQQNLL